MNYDQQAKLHAETQENEPLFIIRVFRISNDASIVVEECRLGLLERNAVLSLVFGRLPGVPFKREIALFCIVTTM